MPDDISHPDGQLENPSVRSEPSDASFRWILGLILGSTVFAALVFYLVLMFFLWDRDTLDVQSRSRFPLAPAPSRALPAEPRLEPLDRLEKINSSNVFLREKARLDQLDSYGSAQEKGFIHIPIDRAMQLLAGKLPARAEAAPELRQSGLVDGGGPNSGRLFNRRKPRWYGE